MAAYTVVYDACVLHPAPLRDLLMNLAVTSLKRPPIPVERFLATLAAQQLPQTVARLRQWSDRI